MGNLQTLKLEYEEYLRNQRGLSERSIYHCWRFADRFLAFRVKGKNRDLSKITLPDIARFMQHLTSRTDAPTELLPVPVQVRKDERQPRSERPSHRPETRVHIAETPDTGAGGNGDRCRQGGYGNRAAQLCHGAASGATRAARGRSHCNPDRRYRLARG